MPIFRIPTCFSETQTQKTSEIRKSESELRDAPDIPPLKSATLAANDDELRLSRIWVLSKTVFHQRRVMFLLFQPTICVFGLSIPIPLRPWRRVLSSRSCELKRTVSRTHLLQPQHKVFHRQRFAVYVVHVLESLNAPEELYLERIHLQQTAVLRDRRDSVSALETIIMLAKD